MKGATISLILGTALIALWLLGIALERPGFRPDIGLLEGVAESLDYRGFGVAFLLAGTTLVITSLLLATLTAVEGRRRAKAEAARAPIKMLFPLVSFIFAALFSVILSPAIISIMINLRT
jgi:hypothetical protein